MSDKVYNVPAEWASRAFIDNEKYLAMYKRSVEDPNGFWGEAGKRIDWIKPYTRVKNTSYDPHNVSIKWYEDGTLNVCANCIDRHLKNRADQVAIIWEGDDPTMDEKITYRQLHERVCKFANVLKANGVKKGDRVTVYLPMIPEAAYAILACARIGAVHSVVFGGFSPDSLAGPHRRCRLQVHRHGGRGRARRPADPAQEEHRRRRSKKCKGDEKVLVVRRTGAPVAWTAGRDIWLHEELVKVDADCPPVEMSAEDPLFILYTSGSTGKPKGVLHTGGGYLVYASLTHQHVFDYHDGDIYWCTADVGWVTGHSYILYGPLSNGATTLMFEGMPNYPTASRFWHVIDKWDVNIFYTAPTAIRALMGAGDDFVKRTDRSSLKLLGTVGEPINPEAWEWYHRVVGDGRCPIVDTWWQTETGGILITPLPGATKLKPGSATRPFFGIKPALVDEKGKLLEGAASGNLVILDSWPGQMRTVYGDHERFVQTYFSTYPGHVLHRRRLPARRGRLLLDHGPRRRRDQRVGPPPRHGRGGVGAGVASQGGRGRRGRLPARHQGPGHLLLRDADPGQPAERGAQEGAGCARAEGDRPARHAGPDPVLARPAQDPLRQDHAPHPAQDRRGRLLQPGRHLHAGRAGRGGGPRQQPAEQAQGGGGLSRTARSGTWVPDIR